MAQWLYDPIASREVGKTRFRLPYPNPNNWYEEMQENEFFIRAMHLAERSYKLFAKEPAAWNEDENALYIWMVDNE